MEKQLIVSRRFQKNTLDIYNYLLKEFSSKVAFDFLDKLQQRVELIIRYPEIGKQSQKDYRIRSLILHPHNRIYYRITNDSLELLTLFDMRKKKPPY